MNEFLIIIILILLNGVLSLSEIALISARKTYLTNEAKQGSSAARVALKLSGEPDRFLSTVQIGITIIGLLTGLFSGSMFADDFAAILVGWGIAATVAHPLAQAIIVVLVTYVTVIFGELVPKRIGMSVAEKAALVVAKPMYWLSVLTYPFVWLLSKSTALVFNLLGLKSEGGKITEEEIKSILHEGAKDGEIQVVEHDIMERVLLMGDLKVSSLMTYRSDIEFIDVHMSNKEILDTLQMNLHEIYPVVEGGMDHIKGMVRMKDLVFHMNDVHFNLQKVMVEPLFFHEKMSVYAVLEQMKMQRVSTALVCDEFGSCQGLITLKDILNGLVDTPSDGNAGSDIVMREDGQSWLVDGQCGLYDFLLFFDQQECYDENNDFTTVGGLILEQLQHIPTAGEQVTWKNFKLEVVDMDGVRIDKLLVSLLPKPASSEDASADEVPGGFLP